VVRHDKDGSAIAGVIKSGVPHATTANGKTLWKSDVGGAIINAPTTYEWAGRQYVLVAARTTLIALALPNAR
jgi:hypothetical protein